MSTGPKNPHIGGAKGRIGTDYSKLLTGKTPKKALDAMTEPKGKGDEKVGKGGLRESWLKPIGSSKVGKKPAPQEEKKVGGKPVDKKPVDEKQEKKGVDKKLAGDVKEVKKQFADFAKDYRKNANIASSAGKRESLERLNKLDARIAELQAKIVASCKGEGGKAVVPPEATALLQSLFKARTELQAMREEIGGDVYIDELREGAEEIRREVGELESFEGTDAEKAAKMKPLAEKLTAKAEFLREFVAQGMTKVAMDNDPGRDRAATLQTFRDRFPDVEVKNMDPKMRSDVMALRDAYLQLQDAGGRLADLNAPRYNRATQLDEADRQNMEALFMPRGGNDANGVKRQNELVKATARGMLADLTPPDLSKKRSFSLNGPRAYAATNEILYAFGQKMKIDPRARLMASIKPDVLQKEIKKYVGGLKISGAKKKALKDNLLKIAEQNRLKPDSVVVTGPKLGMGGTGLVFPAKLDGRDVVVKKAGPYAPERMFLELVNSNAVNDNSNLAKVVGAYLDGDGKINVVMDKIDGFDLDNFTNRWLDPNNPDPRPVKPLYNQLSVDDRAKTAVHLMKGVIRGTHSLHEQGLAHVDVKAENVRIDKNRLEAVVMDFDSLESRDNVPRKDLTMTPSYDTGGYKDGLTRPRENDVYCLGVMLTDLTTGDMNRRVGVYNKESGNEVGGNNKWLPPTHVPVQGDIRHYEPSDDIWRESHPDHGAVRDIKTAIGIMSKEDSRDRPTTRQLLDIIEGREPGRAPYGESGVKDRKELDALKLVFGPGSKYEGGRDVLSGLVGNLPEQ